MNVVSLSGTTGLGENVVTSGLGPGPETPPPTPTARTRRDGGAAWRWHIERLKAKAEEAQREVEEQARKAYWRFLTLRSAAATLATQAAKPEVQPGIFDRLMLPAEPGLMRAPASGWLHRLPASTRAALATEDGKTWLIDGMTPAPDGGVDCYVSAGDPIGRAP